MPSFVKREIQGHEGRRTVALQGGCAIQFGLPFAAMGAGVVAASTGLFRVDDASFHASRALVGAIGGLFLLIGLWLVGIGVASLVRRAAMRRRQRERPSEPWYWDHRWDPEAARLGTMGKTVRDLVGATAFSVFAAPFCIFFFPFGLLVGLLAAAAWGVTVYRVLQRLKYGGSELRFARFPFFLGSELEVSLLGASRLRGYQKLTIALRCLEEKFEKRGDSNTVVTYVLYEDERTYGPGEIDLGPGRPARLLALAVDESPPLALSFTLPRTPYLATRLGADEPRYWELQVTAETPGLDFDATFLVPVYADV